MTDQPIYRLYKKPRFSANHLAKYLAATTAPQRNRIIREAKFPKRNQVSAYQQIMPHLQGFFGSSDSPEQYFEVVIQRLSAKARRETGQPRDAALRCIKAIEQFVKVFKKRRIGNYTFQPTATSVSMQIEGVQINVRLDASIVQDVGTETYSGGCVLFMSGSGQARRNIESLRKTVAGTIYWALESQGGQIEPLPRLSMSYDVFGDAIIRATDNTERLRQNITESCREAAGKWNDVGPPNGYDGPNWR